MAVRRRRPRLAHGTRSWRPVLRLARALMWWPAVALLWRGLFAGIGIAVIVGIGAVLMVIGLVAGVTEWHAGRDIALRRPG
jgi:hypothetical protein